MIFSSYLFIFGFLPLFLVLYYSLPKLRNCTALVFSYVFYAWGAPTVLIVLFLSSLVDYVLSIKIHQRGQNAKGYLIVGIFINISFLFYYKYSNFFFEELNILLSIIGADKIGYSAVVLPIGISFFTFQKISYLVDVYNQKASKAKSFINYALYVVLFPQLIAGPIIRYFDLAKQIEDRRVGIDDVFEGSTRFLFGLSKKVLIADSVGNVADNIFALNSGLLSVEYAWLGALAYSLQIYFDFSAYSDMAIGLGRMLGFRFLENFNFPYIAQNFTDFWRRWHISLSNWMREYLYIPLGGNRISTSRTYVNLCIVFLLSGFWHGASWNFIAWGAFHGFFLCIDKVFWESISLKLPKIVNILLTFLLVLIGWVLFRADSLADAYAYLKVMFLIDFPTRDINFFYGDMIHRRGEFILVLALIFSFLPIFNKLKIFLRSFNQDSKSIVMLGVKSLSALILFFLSISALSSTNFTPFLYFKF